MDEGVRFEVKLTSTGQRAPPMGGSPGKKKSESTSTAGVRVAMSHQLSPLHTRGLTLLESATSTACAFDKAYLDPPKPQLTTLNFKEVAESEHPGAGGASLLQTKKKVKEYIESING